MPPVEGNIIDFQVVLPDQYLFAGLQDVQLPSLATGQNATPGTPPGAVPPQPRVRLTDVFVGYIGTTGELGILSLFQALVMPAERMPGQEMLGQQETGPQLHKNQQWPVHTLFVPAVAPRASTAATPFCRNQATGPTAARRGRRRQGEDNADLKPFELRPDADPRR